MVHGTLMYRNFLKVSHFHDSPGSRTILNSWCYVESKCNCMEYPCWLPLLTLQIGGVGWRRTSTAKQSGVPTSKTLRRGGYNSFSFTCMQGTACSQTIWYCILELSEYIASLDFVVIGRLIGIFMCFTWEHYKDTDFLIIWWGSLWPCVCVCILWKLQSNFGLPLWKFRGRITHSASSVCHLIVFMRI